MKRRLLPRILLAATIGLVSAEIVLQVGYCLVWNFGARGAGTAAAAGHADVLCIGDSFTYGMGASDPAHSYPAQLEAKLRRELGDGLRVANRGWPGRNSRECLEAIDAWLAETKPKYVCIAVGINDTWRLPEEFRLPPANDATAAANDREPYVWTFRLWRMVQAFRTANPFRDQAMAPEAANGREGLVGSWVDSARTFSLRLEADGTGEAIGAKIVWSVEGDRLKVVPDGLPAYVGRWSLRGEELVVGIEQVGELRLRRVGQAPGPDHVALAYEAEKRGDHAVAIQEFQAAIDGAPAGTPGVVQWHSSLVSELLATGRTADANAALGRLREICAADGSDGAGEALGQALAVMGREDEALQVIEKVLPHEPTSPWIWVEYARLVSKHGRIAEARRAMDKAVALSKTAGDQDWSFLHATKALLYRNEADPATFADSAVLSHLASKERDKTRQLLSQWNVPTAAKDPALRAAAAAHGLSDADRDQLLQLRREASGEGVDAWRVVLKSHLQQLAGRCRERGAEPIFGTYPFQSEIRRIEQVVAGEMQCRFLEIDSTFQRLAKDEPKRVLRVTDGHCNDDGYGVIADHYAEVILALERARQAGKR